MNEIPRHVHFANGIDSIFWQKISEFIDITIRRLDHQTRVAKDRDKAEEIRLEAKHYMRLKQKINAFIKTEIQKGRRPNRYVARTHARR